MYKLNPSERWYKKAIEAEDKFLDNLTGELNMCLTVEHTYKYIEPIKIQNNMCICGQKVFYVSKNKFLTPYYQESKGNFKYTISHESSYGLKIISDRNTQEVIEGYTLGMERYYFTNTLFTKDLGMHFTHTCRDISKPILQLSDVDTEDAEDAIEDVSSTYNESTVYHREITLPVFSLINNIQKLSDNEGISSCLYIPTPKTYASYVKNLSNINSYKKIYAGLIKLFKNLQE